MKKLDITGQRFGRLTALARAQPSTPHSRWKLICDCGVEVTVLLNSLRAGRTKSCGCLNNENRFTNAKTHGHYIGRRASGTRGSYGAARKRCLNTTDTAYHRYGGRGIKMCDRWIESFQNFLDDMGERPDGCTLERLDNEKDYEPSNCVWATRAEQSNNQSSNVSIELNGEKMSMKRFAERVGINYYALRSARQRGEDVYSAAERLAGASKANIIGCLSERQLLSR